MHDCIQLRSSSSAEIQRGHIIETFCIMRPPIQLQEILCVATMVGIRAHTKLSFLECKAVISRPDFLKRLVSVEESYQYSPLVRKEIKALFASDRNLEVLAC